MDASNIEQLETLVTQLEEALRTAKTALSIARLAAGKAVVRPAAHTAAKPATSVNLPTAPTPRETLKPQKWCPECNGSRECCIAGVMEDCWTCGGRGTVDNEETNHGTHT